MEIPEAESFEHIDEGQPLLDTELEASRFEDIEEPTGEAAIEVPSNIIARIETLKRNYD